MKYPAFLALIVVFLFQNCSSKHSIVIGLADNASPTELLAAKEIRRYVYLRTGELLEIGKISEEAVPTIRLMVADSLEKEEFTMQSSEHDGVKTLVIAGGSAQALLYGAYEFAEQMGVRFYMHGDVVPDQKLAFSIPDLDLRKKPDFKLRGIQPFHDFPEGPDWWNEQDYKSVVAQLAKMKMNFVGFHTYPERRDFNGEGYKAEPLVWIGKEEDIASNGEVNAGYPTIHFHTDESTWGYSAMPTSDFSLGAAGIFETDIYGADYMKNISPWPHSDDENRRLFKDVGNLFGEVFGYAKELGFTTCLGTETPVTIPQQMAERYGIKNPSDEDIKAIYKGIFTRITQTYPLDYYWLWTPESWTWEGVRDEDVAKTEKDIQLAHEVLTEMGSPFGLATCGWVLGPPKDRAQFDRVLPKDIAFSCINRGLGYSALEPGFEQIQGRSKWAIPWMEDDPGLVATQLWAGRLRKDALDAYRYGCDGLFGIHWRTRELGPSVSSLAKAAWECSSWMEEADITKRDMPVIDFYTDWTAAEFGIADAKLAELFAEIDSKGVELREGYKGDAPLNAATWTMGPGALMIQEATPERVARYNLIPELEAYRSQITSPGYLERFDYWLNSFKFNKALVETGLAWKELDTLCVMALKETSVEKQKQMLDDQVIPARLSLAKKWTETINLLLAKLTTNGELGVLANLEMHNIKKLGYLSGRDNDIEKMSGKPLPAEAALSKVYAGPERLIVTTNPSALKQHDTFQIRVRVLTNAENISGKLLWKQLGSAEYQELHLKHMARNVFEVAAPVTLFGDDFEYYVEVTTGGSPLQYPATAGSINQSVVIF